MEQLVGRLGMSDLGGSYFTFSNENNYMIWTFLKQCWQRGWLYRGADVMPWCSRCATGISQHEIVTDGYQELTHTSITLRLPLRGRERESLLVWTTTPWTLPSNVVAAVGPDLTYVKVRQGDEMLYLSKGTLHVLRGPYEVVGEMPGSALEGWTYDGPFDHLEAARQPGGNGALRDLAQDVSACAAEAHRVVLWDEVSETEGTGIVHVAPGCGAEDFRLGKEHGLPILAPLDEEGYVVEGFGDFSGPARLGAAGRHPADAGRLGPPVPRRAVHAPLPDLLALRHRIGVPAGRRMVHQHGRAAPRHDGRNEADPLDSRLRPGPRTRTGCATCTTG